MARLIDADNIIKTIPNTNIDMFENCGRCTLLDKEDVIALINKAPTIDVEPVVRCKDCMYNKGEVNKKGFRICSANGMDITDDDYCSWGKMMDIGEEE